MKSIVYTSIDDFKLKKWEVRSYTELNESYAEWIEETTGKLFRQRSESELKASEILKEKFVDVYEQPYFMIRGRSFFLDFYLPAYKIAIEIDGGYHKKRIFEDKQRDSLFREIGIRTIRINTQDVCDGRLIEVIFTKLATRNRKHKKNKGTSTKNKNEPRIIRAAMKRLQEHDRNMHKAGWV